MSTESKLNLDQNTIDKLQELIRINLDSAKGFREAADELDENILGEKLIQIANERDRQARELQEYVCVNNEDPVDEGSYAAAVHRCWMKTRSLFSGGDTYAIMAEVERGEVQIKDAYKDALKEEPGSAMNDILLRQFEEVKSIHDNVRDIRDSLKS